MNETVAAIHSLAHCVHLVECGNKMVRVLVNPNTQFMHELPLEKPSTEIIIENRAFAFLAGAHASLGFNDQEKVLKVILSLLASKAIENASELVGASPEDFEAAASILPDKERFMQLYIKARLLAFTFSKTSGFDHWASSFIDRAEDYKNPIIVDETFLRSIFEKAVLPPLFEELRTA